LGRLKEIDISYNRFKALPSCMCTFLDLETINISGMLFLPSFLFPPSLPSPPVSPQGTLGVKDTGALPGHPRLLSYEEA